MWLWVLMLITNLLMPLMLIGFGKIFQKWAPKEINPLFGYRTKMSMKNQDTWQFAHHYFGKLWYRLGILFILASVIVMLFVINSGERVVSQVGVVLLMLECVGMLIPIFFVEKELKRTFDRDGNRR